MAKCNYYRNQSGVIKRIFKKVGLETFGYPISTYELRACNTILGSLAITLSKTNAGP